MLLWGGMLVSNLGAHASGVIYPLLILALSGSPAQASLAAALRMVPYLLLSLPVGALIDRWNRRTVMIICHLGRAAVVASLPVALLLGVLTVEQIYLVAALEGTLFVFFNIAETAALPRVVAVAQLPQATAQNHAGFASAAVVGPALGTGMYQALGRSWPFAFDVLMHLAGALCLWRMRTPFTPTPAHGPRNLRAEVMEGLRWLFHQRLVRDMSVLTGVLNFVHAAIPLLVIVIAKRAGISDAQVGLIFSMGGVGAIVGALVGGRIQQRFSFGQVIIACMALQALAFPAFALAGSVLSLGLLYGWMMFFGPVYNVVQFSYRIALIPDGLQGRVNSSFRLLAHGLNPVGAALCGLLLEHASPGVTVATFGAVLAALALATGLNRAVRTAPRAPAKPSLSA